MVFQEQLLFVMWAFFAQIAYFGPAPGEFLFQAVMTGHIGLGEDAAVILVFVLAAGKSGQEFFSCYGFYKWNELFQIRLHGPVCAIQDLPLCHQ